MNSAFQIFLDNIKQTEGHPIECRCYLGGTYAEPYYVFMVSFDEHDLDPRSFELPFPPGSEDEVVHEMQEAARSLDCALVNDEAPVL